MQHAKILVAVADYPNNDGNMALMYVHTRNKYYIEHGIDVTVLNFNAKSSYTFDNISVISLSEYKKRNEKYDVLVLHAPNIRNHYRFLKGNEKSFKRLIFFFHGHEVLKINEVYPSAYNYIKKQRAGKRLIQNMYDNLKLNLWRTYFPKLAFKSEFIFVSNALFGEFRRYVRLSPGDLQDHISIINNSVGEVFEERSYSIDTKKDYDFITIRSNMDSSVYCIDLLCELAAKFPKKKFLLVGRGEWFRYNKKPKNITWINATLNHKELLGYIDKSTCALMLTRRDTQGVMSCELVTYGIPLITSDIGICKEIFEDSKNVELVSNDISKIDLEDILKVLQSKAKENNKKVDKFDYFHTVFREEQLIKED